MRRNPHKGNNAHVLPKCVIDHASSVEIDDDFDDEDDEDENSDEDVECLNKRVNDGSLKTSKGNKRRLSATNDR